MTVMSGPWPWGIRSGEDYNLMDAFRWAWKSGAMRQFVRSWSVHLLLGTTVLVVVSFHGPFLWMLNQWFVVEEYSPGPAVPIFSSIALWHTLKKRGALPQLSGRTVKLSILAVALLVGIVYLGKEHPRLLPWGGFLSSASFSILTAAMTFCLLYSGFLLQGAASAKPRSENSKTGLAFFLLSLAIHFVALRGDLPRASIIAYVILLFGVSWYLHGWKTTAGLAFPYAILFLMVPLEFIDEVFGVPLRLIATDGAVFLMRLVGLDVQQSGNWFAIGSMEFTVDAPCSGLKSLIALTGLGATFAYVTQPTVLKKFLLGSCAVPIAILTNIFRLACVGVSAELFGKNFAVTVFHDQAAVFLYIISIAVFISLDKRIFQAQWFKVKDF